MEKIWKHNAKNPFFFKYKILTLSQAEVDYKCHLFLGLSVFCFDI